MSQVPNCFKCPVNPGEFVVQCNGEVSLQYHDYNSPAVPEAQDKLV